MKTKKINLTKLLKIGILFFGISLLLYNYEKDEVLIENTVSINLEKVKSIYKTKFNQKEFSNLKKEPLWNEAKILHNNDREYIEIPFRIVKQKELDKSTSMSNDRLLAFISPNNKLTVNIVHYFAQDIKKSTPDFQNLSYFNIGNFNGFVTLYDLDKNIISLDKFNNGIKSNKQYTIYENKKNDDNVFYRMPTDCEMHTETIVTESCWFWYFHETNTTEIISCSLDYNTISYQLCDTNGEGEGGSSDETRIVEEELLEENLIETENLDDCSKSILDSIKDSKPIGQIIFQFSKENSPFSWTLETVDESTFENPSNSAETSWLNSNANNYITKIGTNYKNSATKLSIGRTIVHEAIHAYILSYLDSGIGSFSKKFPELWNDMVAKKYGVPNNNLEQYQHVEMARNYVNTISSVLAEWDNNQQNTQYYKDLAWGGLFETDAFRQSSDLSNTDRTRISNVNNSEDSNSSNSKGNPCN